MSSTRVSVGTVTIVGEGLRPVGHVLGFSFVFTPKESGVSGKNTGSSATVGPNGRCTVVSDLYELTSMDNKINHGTVKWWWHDGTDFDEPALTESGGSGEFTV